MIAEKKLVNLFAAAGCGDGAHGAAPGRAAHFQMHLQVAGAGLQLLEAEVPVGALEALWRGLGGAQSLGPCGRCGAGAGASGLFLVDSIR